MVSNKEYRGVVVPMVSPLTASGEIDTASVQKLMQTFADHDISPLVLGTTGEGASFSKEASKTLVKQVMEAKSPTQKVYVGVVGNQVDEQKELGKAYLDLGADAVVATLPGYYILTPDQMKRYFEELADYISGPLMIYNIKSTTQMSIPLDIIEELSHHPHIKGLKDSERDFERLEQSIKVYKDRADFSFFCGWGSESAKSLALGADGIVPSTGNLVPELYSQLYSAVTSGDSDGAQGMQELTDQVAKIYQSDRTLGQSLATLKLLMNERGLCQPFMKSPLGLLDDEMANRALKEWQGLEIAQF